MNQVNKRDFGVFYSIHDEDAGKWCTSKISDRGYSVIAQSLELIGEKSFLDVIGTAMHYCTFVIVLISDRSTSVIFSDKDNRKSIASGTTGVEENLLFIRILGCKESHKLFSHFSFLDIPVLIDEEAASIRLLDFVSKKDNRLSDTLYNQPFVNRDTQRYKPLPGNANNLDVISLREKEYKEIIRKMLQGNYNMNICLEKEFIYIEECKDDKFARIVKEIKINWEVICTEEILKDEYNYVIISPSGMGKTTFLYNLGLKLLEMNNNRLYLPINLSCFDINKRNIPDIYDFINMTITQLYGNSRAIRKDWGNLCILIDALDQAYNMNEIVDFLKEQTRRKAPYHPKIIISSRENTSDRVPQEFKKLRLKLPGEDEVKNYLNESYTRLEPLLKSQGDLVTTPVLLEMLKSIAADDDYIRKISSRADIYSMFVTILIDKEREKPRYYQEKQEIKDFLNNNLDEAIYKVAFMALNANKILEFDKDSLEIYGINQTKKQALLGTGLICEFFENRESRLIFRHQSFQAYFAARFIHLHPEIFKEIAYDLSYFYHDAWYEVIQFYISLEDDQTKLANIVDLIINPIKNEGEIPKKLRLIHASVLLSETEIFPKKASKLFEMLALAIKDSYGYLFCLSSLIHRFNCANIRLRNQLIDIVIKPLLCNVNPNIRFEALYILGELGTSEHVDLLKPLLMDSDKDVRNEAARGLGKIGNIGHFDLLISQIKANDPYVSNALVVLYKIVSMDSVHLIVPLLKDSDWFIRYTALKIFKKIGSKGYTSILAPLLMDNMAGVRSAAEDAIDKSEISAFVDLIIPLLNDKASHMRCILAAEVIGMYGGIEQADLLLPLLSAREANVRHAAIVALGKIGSSVHVGSIIALFTDNDPYVRVAAVEAVIEALSGYKSKYRINLLIHLLKINKYEVVNEMKGALDKLFTNETVGLVINLLNEKDIVDNYSAVKALHKDWSDNKADMLIALLTNNDDGIRDLAADVVYGLETEEAIDLIKSLIKSRRSEVLFVVAKSLGNLGSSEHIKLLKPLLKNKSSEVRRTAAESLGRIATSRHINLLKPLFRDPNSEVQCTAMDSAGKIGTSEIIKLLRRFLKDKEPTVRNAAAKAILKFATNDHISLLKPLLTDSDSGVRATAVISLGEIGTRDDADLLIPFIAEENEEIRWQAVYSLGQIGRSDHIGLLISLLKDSDLSIRDGAKQALCKIGTSEFVDSLKPLFEDSEASIREAAIKVMGGIGTCEQIDFLTDKLGDDDFTVAMGAVDAVSMIYNRKQPDSISVNISSKPSYQLQKPGFIEKDNFIILHFSDIHFTYKTSWDSDEIFDKFIKSLILWRESTNQRIDLICLTGDIAWSGEETQYEFMSGKINEILKAADCMPDQLLIVPGNHDIQDFVKSPNDNEELLCKIYNHINEPSHTMLGNYTNYKLFVDKMNNYEGFLNKLGCINSIWYSNNGETKPWYVYEIKNTPLIIIGLTSPIFTCKKYHEIGKIKMGVRQLKEAFMHLKTNNISLDRKQIFVLTHHPLNWLDEKEMYDFQSAMYDYGIIHLYGHMHRNDISMMTNPKGKRRLNFGIGSLYGDNGTDFQNSFEIISIDFNTTKIRSKQFGWDIFSKEWIDLYDSRVNPYDLPALYK